MSLVASTLGVGRSTVYDCLTGSTRTRGPYTKAEDVELLPRIRQIAAQRPTYGYRRIAAVLNRQLRAEGPTPANYKRVYRIMAADCLLLARRLHHRRPRPRDHRLARGRQCRHQQFERARYHAGGRGNPFRRMRAPVPLEMLSDNGSACTALEARTFARQLGLKPCVTPVRSPQSNGISEAFVHTLKRDYVRVSSLPDAPTALTSLAGWIEDYNDNHPHSGLKMRSQREHRALVSATA